MAFHAIRNLRRLGCGTVALRWIAARLRPGVVHRAAQATPRNLMGFKDGTRNIDADDAASWTQHVWVGDEEPQRWMRGGSTWSAARSGCASSSGTATALGDQEDVFGRYKASGAPLTGTSEFDTPDFARQGRRRRSRSSPTTRTSGSPRHENNNGLRILRRGYSYTDGIDPETGDARRRPVLHRVP